MSRLRLHTSLLAGLLLAGSQILAQAQTISTSNPGAAVTSGIVGVTGAQSVRLNALNLQPVISGVTAVACPATLEIYDETGAMLHQLVVTNIAPASAASLVFKPVAPATPVNASALIRAVVFTPPASAVTTGSEPTPTVIPVGIGCNIMASLEITDDSTGATHTFTTDFRAMPAYLILPMLGAAR
jgi:hypothetical protein